MKCSGGDVVRVEIDVLVPDGPADPCHLVGECTGSLVMADALFEGAGTTLRDLTRADLDWLLE